MKPERHVIETTDRLAGSGSAEGLKDSGEDKKQSHARQDFLSDFRDLCVQRRLDLGRRDGVGLSSRQTSKFWLVDRSSV